MEIMAGNPKGLLSVGVMTVEQASINAREEERARKEAFKASRERAAESSEPTR